MQVNREKKWIKLLSPDGVELTDSKLKDVLAQKSGGPCAQGPEEKIQEVAQHQTEGDCWVIINGQIYDLTNYIASGQHPQGIHVILEWAGKDASDEFNLHHPPEVLGLVPLAALFNDVQNNE